MRFAVLPLIVTLAALVPQAAAQDSQRLLKRNSNGTPYRLLVPDNYDSKTSYPLVIFLHGGGGRGTDNEQQLGEGNGLLVDLFVTAQKQFPCFVIAPQTATRHDAAAVARIVDDVSAGYRVDRTRVYAIGQSLGGYGIFDLIEKDSNLIAAAVVISADSNAARVQSTRRIPMWLFHGERDSLFPVTGVRRFVAALRAAGDTVKYTEYPGEGHGLAWLVVREKGIVPWLFEHRRAGR